MNYENETWKDIVIEKNGVVFDYTGLYEVSSEGRVRNSRTGRILKPGIHGVGYQFVGLRKNKKPEKFSVHRLVATAFIPNPHNYTIVNHKDENKQNNNVDNLEWCTQKENVNYGTCQERKIEKMKGKNHPKSKQVICLETGQVFDSIREAKEWLGKGDIIHCLRGQQKTAGGYRWMYYDEWLALAN